MKGRQGSSRSLLPRIPLLVQGWLIAFGVLALVGGMGGPAGQGVAFGQEVPFSMTSLETDGFPGNFPEAQLEVTGEQFFIVPGDEGTVRVLQRTVVYNVGPGTAPGVEVSVPLGARLFEPPDGWGDVTPGERGLWDARPLPPGEWREYRVLYELMMGSRPLALRRPLPYPVAEITFWVEEEVLALTGLYLKDQGTEVLSGGPFRMYSMGPVGPHDAWQVVVRPRAGTAASGGKVLPELSRHGERHLDPWAAWREGMARWGPWLALSAAVGVGWRWWRRRGQHSGGAEAVRP